MLTWKETTKAVAHLNEYTYTITEDDEGDWASRPPPPATLRGFASPQAAYYYAVTPQAWTQPHPVEVEYPDDGVVYSIRLVSFCEKQFSNVPSQI